MAFTPGPKLTQQLSLPRRYERDVTKASVRVEERKMPEGMGTGLELLAKNEAMAKQEERIEELRRLEIGPRLDALEAEVKHEGANLRAMINALDRKLEGFGKLVRAPASLPVAGAPAAEPKKPWELEGISERTWYRRKNLETLARLRREKEAGVGQVERDQRDQRGEASSGEEVGLEEQAAGSHGAAPSG